MRTKRGRGMYLAVGRALWRRVGRAVLLRRWVAWGTGRGVTAVALLLRGRRAAVAALLATVAAVVVVGCHSSRSRSSCRSQ